MSFVAEASCVIPVSAAAAFDHLADYGSWNRWMPSSFRPAGASAGRLSPGVQFRVYILGSRVPVPVRVRVAERPRELSWGGGVPGVFLAHHRFLFEPAGDSSVEVRSVEKWSGLIAFLCRRALLPQAERIGREQLAALAASVQGL